MAIIINNSSERLFADLCSYNYLKGFVFHSPKYEDPTEKEVGDIVLWVRTQLIVFEIIWRNETSKSSTRHFIKNIGRKRDQLERDFNAFKEKCDEIHLINELGKRIEFRKEHFVPQNFLGVVLIDCDQHLEQLHFKTIEKSLNLPFANAIMTKQDFLDLLIEVDTIPDLKYYLNDRFNFVKKIYKSYAVRFLDLNNRLERQLIAFYKIHENTFPIEKWKELNTIDIWQKYETEFAEKIQARNEENRESFIIDRIIDFLITNNSESDSTILHAWELAVLTRRARVRILSEKISDAIERMQKGNKERHFAFYNQGTMCWSVFYFQFGGDRDTFCDKVTELAKLKLFQAIKDNNFKYSVFSYGFRKSELHTGNTFDDICLWIEDAENYNSISEQDYLLASKYFGKDKEYKIQEFPS